MLGALLLLLQSRSPDLRTLGTEQLAALIPRADDPALLAAAASNEPVSWPVLDELRSRIDRGEVLSIEAWRTILVERGYLRRRARWPVGRQFALGLQPIYLPVRLVLATHLPGGTPTSSSSGEAHCVDDGWLRGRMGYQTVGWLAPGQSRVSIDVRPYYVAGSPAGHATQRVLCAGTIEIAVEQVQSIDEVLEPVTDPEWGRTLVRHFHLQLAGRGTCLFEDRFEWPRRLGAALDCTVLHDGRVIDARRMEPSFPGHRVLPLPFLSRALAGVDGSLAGWTLRVRGTPKRVLEDWRATQYWAGEFEVPLADLLRR